MRQYLLTVSLVLSLGLAACTDHTGSIARIDPAPQPPIGPSDGNTVGSGGNPVADGGNTQPGGGGSTNGGGGDGTGGGGGGGGGNGGKGGGKGGGGGSPVPEPGTMLLVGTGLAGAALMRRRRQNKVQSA